MQSLEPEGNVPSISHFMEGGGDANRLFFFLLITHSIANCCEDGINHPQRWRKSWRRSHRLCGNIVVVFIGLFESESSFYRHITLVLPTHPNPYSPPLPPSAYTSPPPRSVLVVSLIETHFFSRSCSSPTTVHFHVYKVFNSSSKHPLYQSVPCYRHFFFFPRVCCKF